MIKIEIVETEKIYQTKNAEAETKTVTKKLHQKIQKNAEAECVYLTINERKLNSLLESLLSL